MEFKKNLFKHPSAFLPLIMSLLALSLVIGHIAIFGIVRGTDEGTAAHIWQLLMVGQIPIIALFAIKYLPRKPKQALPILMLQIAAIVAACAPVFILEL